MADNENLGAPQSRNEALLQNILGESYDLGAPQSRNEALLMKLAGEDVDVDFEPQSRIEVLLMKIIENGGTGGNEMTDEQKQAILQLASKVAYIDEDGQELYSDLLNAFYAISSISAVYTQSGKVLPTDSLDSLKSDLVVTATYENSTTRTVNDYTLSGTLAVGTSTITVSYGGKTTTFTVTVSASNYPITLTADSAGVGFGSLDSTKPAMGYVANAGSNRIHCINEDAIGYPIEPNRTYKITLDTEIDTVQVIFSQWNETAKAGFEAEQSVSTNNRYEDTWATINSDHTFTVTTKGATEINGEPPTTAWISIRKNSSNGNFNALSDVLPITIEEL